eukprot:gene44462-60224_t
MAVAGAADIVSDGLSVTCAAFCVDFRRLSRRLFVLTLVSLAPAAVVLFYNLYYIRAHRQGELQEEVLQVGQLASLEMQRIINGSQNVMVALAAAQAIQGGDPNTCFDYLNRVGKQLPQFDMMVVLDRRGVVVCGQNKGALGISLADRPYVQEALKTGKFVAGGYTMRRV